MPDPTTSNLMNRFPRLQGDFAAICDCGGRLAGTASAAAAVELLARLGEAATGVAARREVVPYAGWQGRGARILLAGGEAIACHPLVRTVATPAEGLKAEVVDLGRGTPEEFDAHAPEIAGRIVLVRHELMFNAGTIHRRVKYERALAAGAVGFLIAGPLEGSLVAGSSGRSGEAGIPAVGISPETADRLWPTADGFPSLRLFVETVEAPAEAQNLFFDMPGREDGWVVLSAHIDGHDLAESAMDNASGLAVALSVASEIARSGERPRHGLRLAFFNVEEWALLGSKVHAERLSQSELQRIALDVNIDSVGFGKRLTALTSGFAGLEPFLLRRADECGVPLRLFRPLQTNSDHANFAAAGIPAFRLVAGFGEADAAGRLVLTEGDTRDKVDVGALRDAARLTHAIVAGALAADLGERTAWRGS